jgi:WD40 repeat protein
MEDQPKTHLIVTVHGIRTFGAWQERLENIVCDGADGAHVRFSHYRYGYFSLLAFIFPPLRWLVVRRFRNDFRKEAADPALTRIDLVGHSFGTHIIGWALWGLKPEEKISIHTIILAGSVLRAGFYWSKLVGWRVRRLVNDCGTRDRVLLLSQFFVLFTGMAGRTGFAAMTNERFRNRYSPFGHGGYFSDSKKKPDDGYMREHWKPLLLGDAAIPPFEPPSTGPLSGVMMWIANNLEPVKISVYLGLAIAFSAWVWTQRQTAVQKTAETEKLNLSLTEANTDLTSQKQIADRERKRAEIQRDAALRSQSMAVAKLAEGESSRHNHASALALALEFLPERAADGKRPPSPELERSLYAALQMNRERGAMAHLDDISSIATTDELVASVTAGNGVCVWDVRARTIKYAFAPDGKRITLPNQEVCSVTAKSSAAASDETSRRKVNAEFDEDGKLLAIAAGSADAVVVDLKTGNPIRTFQSGGVLTSLSLDPGGKKLFLATEGEKFAIHDVSSGVVKRLTSGKCSSEEGEASWSDDGKVLMFASPTTICTWNVQGNGPPKVVVADPELEFSATMSSDGRRAIVDLPWEQGELKVVDPLTGQVVKQMSTKELIDAQISTDGKAVLLVRDSGAVEVWNPDQQKVKVLGMFDDPVVSFTSNGKRAAISTTKGVSIVDLSDSSVLAVLSHTESEVSHFVINDDVELAYITDTAGFLRVYETGSAGTFAKRFGGHEGIAEAAFVGLEKVLTVDWKSSLRLFDTGTGRNATLKLPGSDSTASTTVQRVGPTVVAYRGRDIRLVRANDLGQIALLKLNSEVRGFGADPAGKWFVTTTAKGGIDVWEGSGLRVNVLPEGPQGAEGFVGDVSVAPNGALFTIKLRGQRIGTFTRDGKPAGAPLKESGDTAWLVQGDRFVIIPGFNAKSPVSVLKIWNPSDPAKVQTSPALPSPARSARAHPSQLSMALGLDNGMVVIWDLAKGEITKQWKAGTGSVFNVDWSPDGRWLISSDSTTTSIRNGESGELLTAVERAIAKDPASEAERRTSVQGGDSFGSGSAMAVAFSSDSRRVATIDQTGSAIRVIDLSSRNVIGRFDTPAEKSRGAQDSPSATLRFSADGNWLLSTHVWQSARMWRIWGDVSEAAAAACALYVVPLSPNERSALNLDGTPVSLCQSTQSVNPRP